MLRSRGEAPLAPGLVLLIWVLLGALWWGALDARPLARPDEGRYAEIAREMQLSGDWVTPRLNGIKYFEKPPLQYWATALAYQSFGVGERSARLWTVFCGFLSLLFTAWLAATCGASPAVRLLAPVVLAGSLYPTLLGHINTLDSGVTAFLTGTLCCFLEAQRSRGRGWAWMALAGAFAAAAMLSKGLLALVLPGVGLLLYTLMSRELSGWRRLHLPVALASFVLLAGPWFLLCSLRNPEFPHFFFIHEHFERFTSTVHRRVEPAWYFLPLLLAGLLPWTLLLPRALAAGWQGRTGNPQGFRPLRFLLAYATGVLLFFSLSGSKLPSYILPAFPALAVLLAQAVLAPPRLPRLALGFGSLILAGLLLLAGGLFGIPGLSEGLGISLDMDADMVAPYAAMAPWLALGGATVLAGVVLLRLLPDRRRLGASLILGLAGLLAAESSLHGARALAPFNSAAPWVASWTTPLPADGRLFSVGTYDQTLDFYVGRTVILVDFLDELEFGLQQEPALAIQDMAAFRATWGSRPDDRAVMEPERYAQLKASGLPMRLVARDSRHVVVSPP